MHSSHFVQTVVIGLVVGSLFYQLSPVLGTARDFFGASFLVVTYATLSGMSDLSPALSGKGVWFKMRDSGFYPAWAHAIAASAVSLPHQASDCCYFQKDVLFLWVHVSVFIYIYLLPAVVCPVCVLHPPA